MRQGDVKGPRLKHESLLMAEADEAHCSHSSYHAL